MKGILRSGWAQAALDNPVAFFYLFRFITWLLAFIILMTESAPAVNRRFGEGLVLYTAFHLLLATAYTLIVHPRLGRSPSSAARPGPLLDLLVVGIVDMVASLAVVYYSGGWGSPFWHFAITSLLVPCFLLTLRWAMVVASIYAALYLGAVVRGGTGIEGVWDSGQGHLFIGFIFTTYLVAIAVSYLGQIFRALDDEKRRTALALDDLETLFEVTRNVIQVSSDVESLLQQVAQMLRARRRFSLFAIYLRQPGEDSLRLAASTVGVEELDEGLSVPPGRGLVGSAAAFGTVQATGGDAARWRAAIPLRSGEDVLGAVLVGLSTPFDEGGRALDLGQALANQIAIGVRNAELQRQQVELAAQGERNRIAREIHDGVAQSMYALTLSLEACAELAERDKGPLREQLRKLVPLSKKTLLETRHYIYDLRPLLSGETDLVAAAENQVKEFRMVSGTQASLRVEGEPSRVSVAAASAVYRILQESLANVLKHAEAKEVSVALEFGQDSVRLSVRDDGKGFDTASAPDGYGLENMRQRARELGGDLEVRSAPGLGTTLCVTLPAKEVGHAPHQADDRR